MYDIKRITVDNVNELIYWYFAKSAKQISEAYGNKFNWRKLPIGQYLQDPDIVILMAFDGVNPVGFIAGKMYGSFFDPDTRILFQQILYAEKPRVTHALLREFIDFGRLHVNHVISCIGEQTNIKQRSLERLGFTKLEEVYRMEV